MTFPDIKGLSTVDKNKEDFNNKYKCLGCGYKGPRTRHLIPKIKVPCAFFEYDDKYWEKCQ